VIVFGLVKKVFLSLASDLEFGFAFSSKIQGRRMMCLVIYKVNNNVIAFCDSIRFGTKGVREFGFGS